MTTQSLDIAVVPGGRGPLPLPSPYLLQPGYTLISSMSETAGPGNYQLSADLNTIAVTIPMNVTLDAAGHNLSNASPTGPAGTLNVYLGENATLKNANITGIVNIQGDGATILNSTIYCPSSESRAGVVFIYGNNVSLVNNLMYGDYFGYNSGTDDVVLLWSKDSSMPPTRFRAINNIIHSCYDVAIEGVGHFDRWLVQNNSFNTVGACVGGWYDIYRGGDFRISNSVFQGNLAEKSSVGHLFNFSYNNVDDDATATQMWGQSVTVNGRVYDNTFGGDGWS